MTHLSAAELALLRRQPVTEAELLAAYHDSDLHRRGVTFRAALNRPALRQALELGARMARQPGKHQPRDHKALAARNDD